MTTVVDPTPTPAPNKKRGRKRGRRRGRSKSRWLHRAGWFVLSVGIICSGLLAAMQCGFIVPNLPADPNSAIVEMAKPAFWWQYHYLGCAYLCGCLAAWQFFTPQGASWDLRWGVRVGAIASLALLTALALNRQGPVLWWVALGTSLAFWGMIEMSPKPPVKERDFMPSVTLVAVFALMSSAFIVQVTNHRWTQKETNSYDGSPVMPAPDMSPTNVQ